MALTLKISDCIVLYCISGVDFRARMLCWRNDDQNADKIVGIRAPLIRGCLVRRYFIDPCPRSGGRGGGGGNHDESEVRVGVGVCVVYAVAGAWRSIASSIK